MKFKFFATISLLLISLCSSAQTDTKINVTDKQGKKQGHWIKKYPNDKIMYEGYFKDDHPVGEMKRYYEDQSLKSVLTYSSDGKTAEVVIYHPNGFVSARGTYINQKKAGKWRFYSAFIKNYLISEEYYSDNLRNGSSVNFFADSTIAEKATYINDKKQGEWTKYYPSGSLKLKSFYRNDQLNGKFDVWFENGTPEIQGQYRNNFRDGDWIIYKEDGTVKYKIKYMAGISNDNQMEIDEAAFLDSLENNKGKIADPEKTGTIR